MSSSSSKNYMNLRLATTSWNIFLMISLMNYPKSKRSPSIKINSNPFRNHCRSWKKWRSSAIRITLTSRSQYWLTMRRWMKPWKHINWPWALKTASFRKYSDSISKLLIKTFFLKIILNITQMNHHLTQNLQQNCQENTWIVSDVFLFFPSFLSRKTPFSVTFIQWTQSHSTIHTIFFGILSWLIASDL